MEIMEIPKKKYYSSVCLLVKNDRDLLVEWLVHYRRLGFDHVYIIDNGTQPRLEGFLRDYIRNGYITYHYIEQYPIQIQGYNYILNQYRNETTWLAFFDSDEFLVLKRHQCINDFLREHENFGAVSVCWYIFGSSGHLTHQESTIKSYYKRVRADNMKTGQHHYKTIVMTNRTTVFYIHHGEYQDGYFAVDETKEKVTEEYQFPKKVNTNIIQLNHYVIRSLEDFQEKSRRRSGDGEQKQLEYFYRTDAAANEEIDWSIIECHYPEYYSVMMKNREENAEVIDNVLQMLEEEMRNNR
jgi:hypothetical protein